MSTVAESDWSTALEAFRRCGRVFARVGDRRHGNWKVDALRVMRRDSMDPRGWEVADDPLWWWVPDYADEAFDRALAERPEEVEEALPFFGVEERDLDRLYETSRKGAALAIKAALGGKREVEIPCEVETVLARFVGGVGYFTNISELRGLTDEFRDGWSYSPISSYMMDYGAIVVTSSEVGVFWAFDED